MHEILVKRTIYEARCPYRDEAENTNDHPVRIYLTNPPREVQCLCGMWVEVRTQSYVGPEFPGLIS